MGLRGRKLREARGAGLRLTRMAFVMAASLALGPVLIRLIRQTSMTRAIPLAVFLSA